MNPFGYSEPVWRLFRAARGTGAWPEREPGVLTARAGTAAGDAVIQLQCRVGGGRVSEARFMAYGCPTTIAVGAWLATTLPQRALADLDAIGAAGIRDALEIPDERAHCALVGEDAVRSLAAAARKA